MTPKRLAPLVRRPHRSYGLIRPLQTVRHRLRLSPFPMRPRLRLAGQFEDLPGSRHKACGRAWVIGHRGVRRHLTKAEPTMSPSADLRASAPRTNVISVLNSLPIRTATDASTAPSQEPAHGSRRNVARLDLRSGGLPPHTFCQFPWHTESVHIRTHPYTPTRASHVRTICAGGRVPVGEIGLTMACSAHRAVQRISLIFSQEMMMAETLPTGIRLRKTGARASAPGPGGAASRWVWDTGLRSGT